MPSCIPDWRWLEVLRAQAESVRPTDEFAAHVYDVLQGHVQDENVSIALEIFNLPFKRDSLTAFFLSKANHAQIEKGTGIKLEVFVIFEKLFVDPHQFKDKMDVRMYAHLYRKTICQKDNMMQIEKAITDGPFALLEYWSLGNEVVSIPDETIAAKLLGVALRKVSAAAQASLVSTEAKEGLRWAAYAEKILNTRNKLNPIPADAEDLLLELEQDDTTEAIGVENVGFDLDHLVN